MKQAAVYYQGQRITHERGKFWIYCLARPFSSQRAAERWIDENLCSRCLRSVADCKCQGRRG